MYFFQTKVKNKSDYAVYLSINMPRRGGKYMTPGSKCYRLHYTHLTPGIQVMVTCVFTYKSRELKWLHESSSCEKPTHQNYCPATINETILDCVFMISATSFSVF